MKVQLSIRNGVVYNIAYTLHIYAKIFLYLRNNLLMSKHKERILSHDLSTLR